MIDQSGNAMQAERMRAEVVAANMANAETTRTAAGVPYRRQHVVFAAGSGDTSFAGQLGTQLGAQSPGAGTGTLPGASGLVPASLLSPIPGSLVGSGNVAPGVHIAAVVQDPAAPLKRVEPSAPDSYAEGSVSYPNTETPPE